ncbi:hypothetical protein HMPREF9333_01929 [Johnsonella ignava ATCC 51276]|uniref:C_GCAxxG_C_C family protein n=1 Tax=Johnsonella ignava ATCC 51276 TaxID=679200 RepID=G5GK38_9FIRM|nr:C-GCAxxG-C-C family protein [Johnsonella ignava]EHI54916.1 hypothetical protein HMPREF9333_01929 [Johnsonella ignava ATCC 51276]
MTSDNIKELFIKGIDCSQVVAGAFSDELKLEPALLRKMGACFGGGMGRGETCGSYIAALMIIGLKYGHFSENDEKQKEVMKQKKDKFSKKFIEKYSSTMCRQLLGYDLSKPNEFNTALESGRLLSFCPQLTKDTIDILREVL